MPNSHGGHDFFRMELLSCQARASGGFGKDLPGCCYDQDQGERFASSWRKRDASAGVRGTVWEALEGGHATHLAYFGIHIFFTDLCWTWTGTALSPIDWTALQEVDRCGEFKASLARVIIKIYGIRTMFYLMLIMALQIIVSQVYSVYLVQKALSLLAEFVSCAALDVITGLMCGVTCDQNFQFFNPIRLHLELTHRTQETWGYFQWVQNYWQEHGILPDLREPLFMAMAVFSALPMSNILLSSINNHVPKLLFRFLVLATLITFHSHEYNTLIITLII